jgi:hypothetical protein
MSVTTDLLWASNFFQLLSLPLQGALYHHEPKKKGNKDTALLNRIAELHKKGPRNALTEQAMRADLTSDETSGCVHCSCFISKSQFHTRLNRAILRYFQAHRGTYVKFSC